MPAKPKFCLITTPRSGSTWLTTLLDSHPQIKAFEEPFLWREHRPNWRDEVFVSYYDYRKKSSAIRPWALFQYLDILDGYPGQHDTIGYKVMYNHILEQPEILLKLIKDRYKLIHLVRANYLDILISRASKQQYGIAHSTQKSQVKPVVLDTDCLLKTIQSYERNYIIAKQLIELLPLDCLEITYEALRDDTEKVLSKVTDFLGVDSYLNLTSSLKRVNGGSYREKIVNYEEVSSLLTPTKYAKFLSNK